MDTPQKNPDQEYSFGSTKWQTHLKGLALFVFMSIMTGEIAFHPKEFLIFSREAVMLIFGCFSIFFGVLAFLLIPLSLWILSRGIFQPVRKLQLYEDALVLPQGFWKTKYIHISFGDIKALSESHEAGQSRLRLTARDGRKFLIFAAMLPNHEAYVRVRDVLFSTHQNKPLQPSQRSI